MRHARARERPRIIAVASGKGGSGKTSTAAAVAGVLASQGKDILCIDVDPQAGLTRALGGDDDSGGIVDVLRGDASLADVARSVSTVGPDVVTSGAMLSAVERELSGQVGAEVVLREAVQELPSERWDVVILDTPPGLGLLSVNALTSAEQVLIPVEAKSLGLSTVPATIDLVDTLASRLAPGLAVLALLVTRRTRTRHAADVEDVLRKAHGRLVLRATVRESIAVANAADAGEPLESFARSSPVAEDYRQATRELVRRLK